MNRMQQKCIIASVGAHLLLALVLVVGPGFLSPSAKPVDAPVITIIPDLFVDGPPGGGNPKAGQPVATPPKPPPPTPKVEEPVTPPKTVQPKDNTPEPKDEPKDPEAFSLSQKPHKPQISLKPFIRNRPRNKPDESDAQAKAQERRDYERRQELASLIGRAATDIKAGTGAATTVAGEAGINGGGKTYASYASWVLTVFDSAWIAPDDATSEDATAKVKVVIDSDGALVDYRIIEHSGDPAMDASVQRALERVARTGMGKPFPAGMKEKQKTYIIPFNLKNKRGTA